MLSDVVNTITLISCIITLNFEKTNAQFLREIRTPKTLQVNYQTYNYASNYYWWLYISGGIAVAQLEL